MKEHTVAVRAASPSPVLTSKSTTAASTTTPSSANLNRNNSNHQLNSSSKPTQRVLSFLRKRTGTTAVSTSSSPPTSSTIEKDRVKSTIIPTSDSDRKDRESASPSPTPMSSSSASASAGGVAAVTSSLSKGGAGNPIKNMIRRRSVELGRLFEGGAGASKRNTDSGRNSPHPDASQESQSEQGSGIEFVRSASPTLAQPIPVIPVATPAAMNNGAATPSSRPSRRPGFALGLPWRPQSEYTVNGSTGLRSGLSRAQRRFVSAFPELADLVMVPSAYCAPCLATPPPTPPVPSVTTASPSLSPMLSPSLASSATILSPSGTGNTLMSTSTTSMATLAPTNSTPCPGHFNDFACALEREILWQGTLYVTATHVCFYGRHFGKTVRVMIDYQDLVSVEKEKKMGVFPSSIRVRVRTTQPSSAAASGGEEDTTPTPLPSTKDYVFTSLMSREQAYAIIERNWALNRQVMNSLLSPIMTPGTLSSSGFETPRSDTPDPLERPTTLMFDLDFEARRARSSGSLRAHRRKSPRTYSVVTDEALSGSEDLDRPALHGRLSSSRLMTVSTMASDTEDAKDGVNGVATDSSAIAGSSSDVDSGPDSGSSSDVNAGADAETVVDGNTAEEATPKVKDSLLTPSSSSSEDQKDYVTSAVSSEKQQEATGFRSFIQSRTSQLKRVMSSDGNGSTDHLSPNTLEYRQQDVTTTHLVPELAYPSPVASSPISIYVSRSTSSVRSGSSNNNGSSNHLNNNHSSSSISGNSRTGGSSTPPPILISPSMTTTKVSHSSSTVQSVAEPGTCRNMSLHLRKESREALLEGTRADLRAKSRAKAAALSKAKAKARRVTPAGPVACNCQRHYKNAVASTVIPLPLNLCFELLFSGKGAGEGDKLTCDTHRFKDGSTEIKITPWQREERLAKSMTMGGNAAWEDQKRNLEYSVTFKVPMLAKASTQCLEVQQVVQYNDSLILVHSESRTPNVPYGEQFTTVSQVCMTWESPMRTKIKCFMEVKFKKSIMLASRVESGALEGSGGYLKELIKQLQDLTEAQGPQLIRAWESNNQVEDSSAVDYDTDDSDEDGDTDSDSNTEPESDSDDKASTTESTNGANGVIKATGGVSHEGVSHTTASTGQGSASSLLSVTRRPVATEMSRAQSLLSQQFLRSAPQTTATDTVRAGAPARLSLDSARPENVGVSTRDPLTPLLPSERKSALAMLWENFTPPIITVAAAALTFNESKGFLTSAGTDFATKGAVLKEDVALPSTTATSMTTTTIATNIPIAPTAVTAAAPAVAGGASSSPVWGEFVRRGLTFFGKAPGQDGNPGTLGKTAHSATRKDRTNDDTSSLSSVSTSSDSYDDSVSRPDGVRVKFALPAGPRRSHSKSVDDGRKGGKNGRSNGSSSSVRSIASVPSLGSAFREQGQRSNGRHLGAQSEDKDLTKTQSSGPLSSQRNNGRPWVLSRIIFAFVILGMAITALNVWHLLSIVSSVIEVVEQRNDFSSNSRLQAQLSLRQQQQRRAYLSSFSSRYQQYPGRRYLQPWERYRQQQHYRDSYYYYQQQQAWENDEDYKSWYQRHHPDPEDQDSSAQHVEEPPASEPASVSASDSPSSEQLNAPWEEEVVVEKEGHAQKVQLKAQIEELLAMLEHAREELRQSKAQS